MQIGKPARGGPVSQHATRGCTTSDQLFSINGWAGRGWGWSHVLCDNEFITPATDPSFRVCLRQLSPLTSLRLLRLDLRSHPGERPPSVSSIRRSHLVKLIRQKYGPKKVLVNPKDRCKLEDYQLNTSWRSSSGDYPTLVNKYELNLTVIKCKGCPYPSPRRVAGSRREGSR
ncbi:hypothetical protein J6590_015751 [Homalodisca vitripennis]|nr:hypothetical protein J6590_015751 [Homalodisca vitripennis]